MEKQDVLNEIKSKALENHVPILQDVSMELIIKILEENKPNKILEIGTAVGYSSIIFSKYLVGENAKIKTIERNEKMYNIAIENIKSMNLESKIEVVLSDATKYLQEIDEEKEQFDIVFIDAAKGQYMIFLENAIRLIKNGGIIIADNVLFKGRVMSDYNEHKHRTAVNKLRDYIKTIQEDSRLESCVYDIGDGVAVSIVKK